MGRNIATFVAILIASLAIARQLGITLPSPRTGLNQTSIAIFLGQFTICYFSRFIAELIVERPERLQGDVDGSLTAGLLNDRTKTIQGIIGATVSIASGGLVIAKICCPDGIWSSPPEYAIPLVIGTAVSEFIVAGSMVVCEESSVRLHCGLMLKHPLSYMHSLHR